MQIEFTIDVGAGYNGTPGAPLEPAADARACWDDGQDAGPIVAARVSLSGHGVTYTIELTEEARRRMIAHPTEGGSFSISRPEPDPDTVVTVDGGDLGASSLAQKMRDAAGA